MFFSLSRVSISLFYICLISLNLSIFSVLLVLCLHNQKPQKTALKQFMNQKFDKVTQYGDPKPLHTYVVAHGKILDITKASLWVCCKFTVTIAERLWYIYMIYLLMLFPESVCLFYKFTPLLTKPLAPKDKWYLPTTTGTHWFNRVCT